MAEKGGADAVEVEETKKERRKSEAQLKYEFAKGFRSILAGEFKNKSTIKKMHAATDVIVAHPPNSSKKPSEKHTKMTEQDRRKVESYLKKHAHKSKDDVIAYFPHYQRRELEAELTFGHAHGYWFGPKQDEDNGKVEEQEEKGSKKTKKHAKESSPAVERKSKRSKPAESGSSSSGDSSSSSSGSDSD